MGLSMSLNDHRCRTFELCVYCFCSLLVSSFPLGKSLPVAVRRPVPKLLKTKKPAVRIVCNLGVSRL